MLRPSSLLLFSSVLLLRLSAQPTITAAENAASNIVPGLPNAGIAQGAIFVVFGTGLGPANISVASQPFQSTTLSGTSVSVNVGGTLVSALMYYTSASQVAALLPSNTPAGTGTITVTYNNQTSAAAAITVVQHNLGIFTVDSSGGGAGIVTFADYSLVSPVKASNCGGPNTTCGAANPGDTLILWGTGLGSVTGSDASGAGLGQNMPNLPLKLWLGGVQAPVLYQGRSGCCIGEDQVVFTVPNSVPTGCAVPLLVQINNQISNNVILPVANGSRTCSFSRPDYSAIGAQQVEQFVSAGPVSNATIRLNHFSDGGGAFEDDARVQFLKLTSFIPGSLPFIATDVDDQAPGTCIVYNNPNASFANTVTGAVLLDAGSSATLTGPKGSVSIPVNGKNAAFNMTGAFLVPGDFTISGPGGTDVPAFSGTITLPPAATLVSPTNNSSATRANGLTVSWTGGSGSLEIAVNGCVDSNCNTGASALCHIPASLGSFTVPAYVLQALPASTLAGLVLSSYSMASFTNPAIGAASIETYSNLGGFGFGWGSGGFSLK